MQGEKRRSTKNLAFLLAFSTAEKPQAQGLGALNPSLPEELLQRH